MKNANVRVAANKIFRDAFGVSSIGTATSALLEQKYPTLAAATKWLAVSTLVSGTGYVATSDEVAEVAENAKAKAAASKLAQKLRAKKLAKKQEEFENENKFKEKEVLSEKATEAIEAIEKAGTPDGDITDAVAEGVKQAVEIAEAEEAAPEEPATEEPAPEPEPKKEKKEKKKEKNAKGKKARKAKAKAEAEEQPEA